MTNPNLPPEIVNCSECGIEATNDRACNGDGLIRCTKCAVEKYKRECPFWWCWQGVHHPIIRITA